MSKFAGCLIQFCSRFVVSFLGSNCFKFVCRRNGSIGSNFALKVSLSKIHFYALICQFLWCFGCSGFQRLSCFSIWVLIKFSGLRAFCFSKRCFLKSILTICVKRLTKHLRVTHNAWRFQFKLGFSV